MSQSKNFLVSQHIPGKENVVADWLTFEGDDRSKERNPVSHPLAYDCPSNEQLTNRLLTHCPQLVPQHFEISHLPTEIFSFAQEGARMLESSMIQKQREQQRTPIESGADGFSSADQSSRGRTQILSEYAQSKPPRSSEPFSRYIESQVSQPEGSFVESVKYRWQGRLSELPQGFWERSSGIISGRHPCTVGSENKRKRLHRTSAISSEAWSP